MRGSSEVLKRSGRNLADAKTFNEPITCGMSWGSAPTIVEGISATVMVKTDEEVEVWSLDNVGDRSRRIPVSQKEGFVVFSIEPSFETIWYEIAIKE